MVAGAGAGTAAETVLFDGAEGSSPAALAPEVVGSTDVVTCWGGAEVGAWVAAGNSLVAGAGVWVGAAAGAVAVGATAAGAATTGATVSAGAT